MKKKRSLFGFPHIIFTFFSSLITDLVDFFYCRVYKSCSRNWLQRSMISESCVLFRPVSLTSVMDFWSLQAQLLTAGHSDTFRFNACFIVAPQSAPQPVNMPKPSLNCVSIFSASVLAQVGKRMHVLAPTDRNVFIFIACRFTSSKLVVICILLCAISYVLCFYIRISADSRKHTISKIKG